MNKAFVKESDDAGNHCPKCGSLGTVVFQSTLEAHVPPGLLGELSSTAYFCPHATCNVAYFDQFERTISAEQLIGPVYPKDPDAPICPCFGLTCEDIEAAAGAGDVERVRQHLRRAESDEACCATLSPTGQTCIVAVQRYFMQCKQRN
jgi:hypothetical protein